MHSEQRLSRGFTITELSIAMSLFSVLLFILVISAVNFTNIYNKGITLKRVNQSGGNIAKELQTNLGRSSEVQIKKDAGPGNRVIGVCAGDYSFVWSVYPSGAGSGNQAPIIGLTYSDDTTPLYFAKVEDPAREMCSSAPPKPYKGDCPSPLNCYSSTELLGDGLVIRDPGTAANPGGLDVILNEEGKLVTVVYTISTNGGEDIISDATNRSTCQGGATDTFCALNTFVVTSYSKGVYND